MRVTVLNSEEELKSFPLTQSINISVEGKLERATIKDSIYLIRNINNTGLFNFSNTYNQSLGYIKEKFDVEAINIDVKEEGDNTQLTITPLTPLSPGFDYTLIVSKQLSKPFLITSKENSKSTSDLKLETIDTKPFQFSIKILSDPLITNTSNIVKFLLTDLKSGTTIQKIIDLKKTNTFIYNGTYTFNFKSQIYVKDEEFVIISEGVVNDVVDYTLQLKACLNDALKPITNTNTSLSLTDLLSTEDNKQSKEEPSYSFSYINNNTFCLSLNNISVSDLDLEKLTYTVNEALNMYTLSSLGLYNPTNTYKLQLNVEDESTLYIEVVYES